MNSATFHQEKQKQNTRQQQQHNQHEINKEKQRFFLAKRFCFVSWTLAKRNKISRVACVCIKVQIQNKTDFKQPTNSCSIHWNGPNNGSRVYTKFKRVVDTMVRVYLREWEREREGEKKRNTTAPYERRKNQHIHKQHRRTY